MFDPTFWERRPKSMVVVVMVVMVALSLNDDKLPAPIKMANSYFARRASDNSQTLRIDVNGDPRRVQIIDKMWIYLKNFGSLVVTAFGQNEEKRVELREECGRSVRLKCCCCCVACQCISLKQRSILPPAHILMS
jgi:hypothetical protein